MTVLTGAFFHSLPRGLLKENLELNSALFTCNLSIRNCSVNWSLFSEIFAVTIRNAGNIKPQLFLIVALLGCFSRVARILGQLFTVCR